MQSSHSNSDQTSSDSGCSPDEKIIQDLSTLSEQITLCQSMLVNAGGPSSIDSNEALLAVIGFLEACVPRMVELIEAAAQGALKPETFEECLVINDKLANVLADVDKDPKDRQPLTPAAASAGAGADDNDSGATPNKITDVAEGMKNLSVAGGKTTGLDSVDDVGEAPVDDPFAGGPDLLAPTPATTSNAFKISESLGSTESAEAATKTNEADDDFDAFFRGRTSAP